MECNHWRTDAQIIERARDVNGIFLAKGELEVSAEMLCTLGIPTSRRARVLFANVYEHPGRNGATGYYEVIRNGVPVGFVRWSRNGFFWHALVEH